MAEIIHTTQEKPAKHSPASDRVALEVVNDLLQDALRADWTLHVSHAGLDTEVGRTLGHAAALAWANFENALGDLRLMSEVNLHIRDAATRPEYLLPPVFPMAPCSGGILQNFSRGQRNSARSMLNWPKRSRLRAVCSISTWPIVISSRHDRRPDP